jgi:hypothetical protein
MNPRFLAAAVAALGLTCLPAYADVINITTPTSTATTTAAIGGTVQLASTQLGTGSGVLNPFLTTQANGSSTTEQGYNTGLGGNSPDFDTKRSGGGVTKQLNFSDLGTKVINGVSYVGFYLDANQTGSAPLISLNQVQIFQSKIDRMDGTATPATATTPAALGFSGSQTTEVFRLNNSSDPNYHQIVVDSSLGPGSGDGDLFFYVPASDFNVSLGNFIIFYTEFGTPPGSDPTNDGFEEWGTVSGAAPLPGVPAPANLILAATGIAPLGLFGWLRRRKS